MYYCLLMQVARNRASQPWHREVVANVGATPCSSNMNHPSAGIAQSPRRQKSRCPLHTDQNTHNGSHSSPPRQPPPPPPPPPELQLPQAPSLSVPVAPEAATARRRRGLPCCGCYAGLARRYPLSRLNWLMFLATTYPRGTMMPPMRTNKPHRYGSVGGASMSVIANAGSSQSANARGYSG